VLHEAAALEALLLRGLGVAIAVEIATGPIDPELLTAAERRKLERLHDARRREEWLTGRAARASSCGCGP
jgi:hypothetical protein